MKVKLKFSYEGQLNEQRNEKSFQGKAMAGTKRHGSPRLMIGTETISKRCGREVRDKLLEA